MKVIHLQKRGGKTTKLIEIAHQNNYYIVCQNKQRAIHLFHTAKQAGKRIPFPITYNNFIHREFHGAGIKGFVIDDVDMMLQKIAGNAIVAAISINKEDPDTENPHFDKGEIQCKKLAAMAQIAKESAQNNHRDENKRKISILLAKYIRGEISQEECIELGEKLYPLGGK